MIWLIIVLAFILRIINLNQSLWFDEAINVVFAQANDFWWFIIKYPIGDFHPPGWFAILWGWGHIFGFSEISVRMPSVILGVSTVGLVYLLGKDLFNKKVALLASLLLSIAPLHVYYSQEARMYVFAAFSVTLSFYFLNRLMLNNKLAGVGLIASLILVLYSDYLAYFIIPVQIIYLIWVKKLNIKILLSYLIAGMTLIPWLSIFPLQLQTGINKSISLPGWEQVVGGSNIKDLLLIPIKTFFGRVTVLNKYLYLVIFVFVGIIVGSVFLLGLKKLDQSTRPLLCWLLIPIILAFLISFFIPVLSYFRLIYILPAFYLVLGKGIESLPKRVANIALIFICLVSIVSLAGYYLNPKFQRENWRGAINFVSQNLDRNSIVIFTNNEVPAPVRYYNPDLLTFKPGISANLSNDLAGKNKIFLFEYLSEVYDPQRLVQQKIKGQNLTEIEVYNFEGVGLVREYRK